MTLAALQLPFDRLADELGAFVRSDQAVDALQGFFRQPDDGCLNLHRGAPHKIISLKAISLIDVGRNICDIGYISKRRLAMALKIWTDFKIGDRVMASDCERDIGTIMETGPDATVAGRALVRWDDGADPSWLRADLLKPSPHVEDETWEYMLDLLLDGEVTPEDFRSQMTCSGYSVVQINNAIDYNWGDIRAMMSPETA